MTGVCVYVVTQSKLINYKPPRLDNKYMMSVYAVLFIAYLIVVVLFLIVGHTLCMSRVHRASSQVINRCADV